MKDRFEPIFFCFSCSISTHSFYLPQNYGTVLMLEVAVIRYYLAIKAAHCEYPSNLKVQIVSVSIFCCYAATIFGYIAFLTYKDIPYSFLTEFCSRPVDQVRPLVKPYLFSIQAPFILNFVSLIVDLCLVQFLRKNSLKEVQDKFTLGTITKGRNRESFQMFNIIFSFDQPDMKNDLIQGSLLKFAQNGNHNQLNLVIYRIITLYG